MWVWSAFSRADIHSKPHQVNSFFLRLRVCPLTRIFAFLPRTNCLPVDVWSVGVSPLLFKNTDFIVLIGNDVDNFLIFCSSTKAAASFSKLKIQPWTYKLIGVSDNSFMIIRFLSVNLQENNSWLTKSDKETKFSNTLSACHYDLHNHRNYHKPCELGCIWWHHSLDS